MTDGARCAVDDSGNTALASEAVQGQAAEETAVEVEPDAEEAPKSPAATEVAVHNAAAETPAEHKALRKSLTQIIKAYRRSKRE